MKSVGTAELKARLSEHLRAVRAGKGLIVRDRNVPIARILPYEDPGELLVQAARSTWDGFAWPAPTECPPDSTAALREERGER